MYFSFNNPFYLAFLFAVPFLVFLHFYSLKNLKKSLLKFANFDAMARVKGVDIYSRGFFKLFLNILILVLIVFAISGLTMYKETGASSFSYVLAIDVSESMTAKDFQPNRITVAKETAMTFVNSLPYETYLGIISFSGDSDIEAELTRNKQILLSAIKNVEISNVSGTDVMEVIINSEKMLRDEKNKALVIISDGQINIGNFDDILANAVDSGMIIHSIGIGTNEGGEVEIGNWLSKLDEDSLKSLAYNTGGEYSNAGDREKLEESFRKIISETRKISPIDMTSYILIAVLFLLIGEYFLTTINKL